MADTLCYLAVTSCFKQIAWSFLCSKGAGQGVVDSYHVCSCTYTFVKIIYIYIHIYRGYIYIYYTCLVIVVQYIYFCTVVEEASVTLSQCEKPSRRFDVLKSCYPHRSFDCSAWRGRWRFLFRDWPRLDYPSDMSRAALDSSYRSANRPAKPRDQQRSGQKSRQDVRSLTFLSSFCILNTCLTAMAIASRCFKQLAMSFLCSKGAGKAL